MSPRAFRVDPHRALRRSLAELLGGSVSGIADDPWSSMTLEGRRHRFRIVAPANPERFAAIADIEFALPGHLVADIAVEQPSSDSSSEGFVIEALTIALDPAGFQP